MDPTAEYDARRATKRARIRLTQSEEVDMISGLDEDLLLRILGLVGDARDVVRTAVLSRRWLGLWTRVPALRFASPPGPWAVDGVLAARRRAQSAVGYYCAIESLHISCTLESERTDAVQGWIRYAFLHGVKSLSLILDLDGPMLVLDDELPHPTKLETMRLEFRNKCRIRLPTAMKLASVTDLSLGGLRIPAGDAHLLARLLSKQSCPHLQKLRLVGLAFVNSHEVLRLEAPMLSELWVEKMNRVMLLELRTPCLRVLHVDDCDQDMFRISSAPRLEQLELFFRFARSPISFSPRYVEVDGDSLPCVRRLGIGLWSYVPRYYFCPPAEAINDANRRLIKLCSSLTNLDVTLWGRKESQQEVEILKSRIPHLPHITSLTVNVSSQTIEVKPHDFGASMATLLTRFTNLRRLSMHLPSYRTLDGKLDKRLELECDHSNHWIPNEISLSHLEEVEFTGLIGIDCELWFMKDVLTSARGIHKVAVNFNPMCWQHQTKMDAFERMLLDEGMWTSHRDAFKLTCLK